MIAVIDYGRGNLGSVEKALGRLGMRAVVTQDPRVIEDARALVLPGDGAFHDAMGNLQSLGLLEPLRAAARRRPAVSRASASATSCSSPRARSSARARGSTSSRAWFVAFPPGSRCRTWVGTRSQHDGRPRDLRRRCRAGRTSTSCTRTIRRRPMRRLRGGDLHLRRDLSRPPWAEGALFATQFHPEKSQRWGLRLLENFAAFVRDRRGQ